MVGKIYFKKVEKMTNIEFIDKISKLKGIMKKYIKDHYKDYSEGGKFENVGDKYKKLFIEIEIECEDRQLLNKNSFRSLYDFFEYYYIDDGNKMTYTQKEKFIDDLYKDAIYRVQYEELKANKISGKDTLYENLIRGEITTGKEEIDRIINNAVIKFFSKKSTLEDKKDSIVNLANILQKYRNLITKDYFGKKDENDLFSIANGFGLRHLDKNPKMEYDKDIFYRWIFFTYLNAIHLILDLQNRKKD